jgi:uncharacterized protein YcnI
VRRRAAAAAFVALAAAAPATAHVIPQPAFLAPGAPTTITFAAPNERRPHVMVGFTLTAPAGIEFGRATPPPGWRLGTAGRTADWSLEAVTVKQGLDEPFRIAASTSLAPGAVAFHAVQRYDDGGLVRWTVAFTILPAATATPREHLLPAIVTAILGLVVIGLLLFRMRDRHRRDVQGE